MFQKSKGNYNYVLNELKKYILCLTFIYVGKIF